MCWIFAYNGKQNSIPLLVDGLRNLEYRWYDSAGVFWVNDKKEFFLEKAVWKVSNLAGKVEKSLEKENTYRFTERSCRSLHTEYGRIGIWWKCC